MIIGIDPGHGGDNIGCEGFGIHEEAYTLRLGLMLRDVAMSMGIAAVMSREVNESVSFPQRAQRLQHADAVIVIHVNKAGVDSARDMRCYCVDGDTIADAMGKEIERVAPIVVAPVRPSITLAAKGTPTDHAYNTLAKHRPKPALLVETFFVSHPASAAFAKQLWGPPAFVNAMAAGILCAWQRLAAVAAPAPQTEPAIAAQPAEAQPTTEEVPA